MKHVANLDSTAGAASLRSDTDSCRSLRVSRRTSTSASAIIAPTGGSSPATLARRPHEEDGEEADVEEGNRSPARGLRCAAGRWRRPTLRDQVHGNPNLPLLRVLAGH